MSILNSVSCVCFSLEERECCILVNGSLHNEITESGATTRYYVLTYDAENSAAIVENPQVRITDRGSRGIRLRTPVVKIVATQVAVN